MRISVRLVATLAVVVACVACGPAGAQVTMPDAGPLAVPPAPARVVVPPAPEPIPAAPSAPAVAPTSAQPPATRPARDPKPVAPPATPPPAAAPPVAPPAPPTSPLEATGDSSGYDQKARTLAADAKAALERVDYKSLSIDGKAQYDTAKRFLKQADDALKVKNVIYAWQLADKANTIATLLQR